LTEALALRLVQERLETYYALEKTPDVTDFVRVGGPDSREMLLLRQAGESLEIALYLPPNAQSQLPCLDDPARATDHCLQVLEGISHFVYIAERARTGLPTTQLELELQAEVDKFVLLALGAHPLEPQSVQSLHDRLYERVRFIHPPDTEAGERYRMANGLAARFVARLVRASEPHNRQHVLRRFYRSGQADKIRLARGA
jgi:hypothetical protein